MIPSWSRPDPLTPAQPAAPTGIQTFLLALVRSRLIERPRLDAILTSAPAAVRNSPREFADHLIAAGELTHYQSEKLLGGLWQGLVLGPYHVLAPLGRGGMGTVYLARDTRVVDDRPGSALVALKILPPKRAREEERTLARFLREMELGKMLSTGRPGTRSAEHPNLTRTIETGEVGGIHYIAMEYVPGQSLRQAVTRGGPLSVPDAARVFADVSAGLAHAHARGLIHRDLKPSNIMVTPEGRAKVLDLGLAMLMGETLPNDPAIVGGQGYVLGTMDYIAPEQTTDATNVGPWSDLYAVGCSLYFALTGAPPFPGGTSQQKIKWHRSEAPPPVNLLNPNVPAEFARLVERLMAKRPEDRPDSAAAVRGLLLPWSGEAVPQPSKSVPHTDRETVATFDQRSFDPSLWDSAPVLDVASAPNGEPTPSPARARSRRPSEEPDPDEAQRWQAALFTLAVAGLVLGLMVLVFVAGLLRRL
jgi:serine/threonine protein kinase